MTMKKILTLTTLAVVLSSFLVGCKNKDVDNEVIDNNIKQENVLNDKNTEENKITQNNDISVDSSIEKIEDIKDIDVVSKEFSYYVPNDNVDGLTKVTLRGNIGEDIATPQYLIDRFIQDGFIAQNTKVNKFSEISEGVYNLDLSKEFYSLSFGTSAEGLILDSIGNSFIENFSIKKLKLTVEGTNYESGHILMEDNDYLTFVELNENSTQSLKVIE